MSTSVEWCEDGSAWVEYRSGRKRWIPKDDPLIERLRTSLTLDFLGKVSSYDRDHSRMVYYIDNDGKVAIPPDPRMVPSGFEAREVKSLREADTLRKRMTSELHDKFGEDQFTEFMDMAQADEHGHTPRHVLAHTQPLSNYERDMIHHMLEVLDKEEADRNRITTETHFHWREFSD